MAFPFFYSESINLKNDELVLNEETSKHVVQVLRMQNGERIQLTDGKGNIVLAEIINNHKKNCLVKLIESTFKEAAPVKNTIAISLLKNAHRFEWFLEKATEVGISEIIPLICTRTEKQHFRFDRMQGILTSAMLQSQQCWLPLLHEPLKFNDFVKQPFEQQKFIAHCEETDKKMLNSQLGNNKGSLVCIGPEGDFTVDEIYAATENYFSPAMLGNTRLRTETAGMVAATLLMIRQ